MHPTQAILRPLSHRVLTGAGVRYARNVEPRNMHKRSMLTLKDHVVCSLSICQLEMRSTWLLQYFSKATAEGPGRNGLVKSNGDSPLELRMSIPRTAGGKGDGQNPEQLFAMGYACESSRL